MKQFLTVFAVFTSLTFSSHALAIEVTAIGGMHVNRISQTPENPNLDDGFGLGVYGAGAEFTIVPLLLGLEVDLLIARQGWVLNNSSYPNNSYSQIQIPIIGRLRSLPIISPGLGVYFGSMLGDINLSGPAGDTTSPAENAGFNKSDFGAVASLKAGFEVAPALTFVADVRYLLGLKNISLNPAENVKQNGLQLLAGVQFGF